MLGPLAEKARFFRSRLLYLRTACGLVWRSAPGWTLALVGLTLVQGLIPLAIVNLTRLIIDRFGQLAGPTLSLEAAWSQIMAPVVLFGGVVLLDELVRGCAGWFSVLQEARVSDQIRTLIHRKAVEVDLAEFEGAEHQDRLHRATMDPADRVLGVVDSGTALCRNAITSLGMMGVLFYFGWWVPLLLFISMLPVFWHLVHYSKRRYNWRRRMTSTRRRIRYFDRLILCETGAAEIRLFRLGTFFRQTYLYLRRRVQKERLRLEAADTAAGLGVSLAGMLVVAGALAYVVVGGVHQRYTLGDLAMFVQAMRYGRRISGDILDHLGELYRNSMYLNDLFEFLSLEPRIRCPAHPSRLPSGLAEGIRFDHVSFRYPGAKEDVLSDLSATFPAGGISAIVGPNGSGKSTLAKLMCRFYDPSAGAVRWDAVDLRRFDPADLRKRISALFQRPVRYQLSALQNIVVGDLEAPGARERAEQAVRAAGALEVIQKLPRGFETLLGKSFRDGQQLSHGEWQRLALARAFFAVTPVLILDEPTSAMDPWAEAQWVRRFREASRGRTCILITHRITTARYADVIFVLDRGRLREQGAHDALVRNGGRYASLWAGETHAPFPLASSGRPSDS